MTDGEALIRRYYSAFNTGDRRQMLSCLSEHVAHDVNEGERRIGHKKFSEFMNRMDRCYDEQLKDIVVMMDRSGSRASAEFVVHGRYIADDDGLPPALGQVYVLPAGAFFEIANGLITRLTTYYNLKNWIAQVSR